MERRIRKECAVQVHCLSPAVGTHRQREELDRKLQECHRQGEELNRNAQLQLLIASTHRQREEQCAATSPYCLSPAVSSHRQGEELDRNAQLLIASVSTHRQRVELDRNVQLQVLIASVLQLVLTDREKN